MLPVVHSRHALIIAQTSRHACKWTQRLNGGKNSRRHSSALKQMARWPVLGDERWHIVPYAGAGEVSVVIGLVFLMMMMMMMMTIIIIVIITIGIGRLIIYCC